MIHSIPHL